MFGQTPLCARFAAGLAAYSTGNNLVGRGQGLFVNVGRKDDKPNGRMLVLKPQLPKEREAVGFLAGRTTKTPASNGPASLHIDLSSKVRHEFLFQEEEHALVSVEP